MCHTINSNLFTDNWAVCWYHDFGINRYRVVIMTHQTLSLIPLGINTGMLCCIVKLPDEVCVSHTKRVGGNKKFYNSSTLQKCWSLVKLQKIFWVMTLQWLNCPFNGLWFTCSHRSKIKFYDRLTGRNVQRNVWLSGRSSG